MTEYGTVSELWCRCQYQASMPLLDQLIGLVLPGVSAAAQPDEFASALQASKIIMVMTHVQKRASHPNVVHDGRAQRIRSGLRNLVKANLWITSQSFWTREEVVDAALRPTPHQLVGLRIICS